MQWQIGLQHSTQLSNLSREAALINRNAELRNVTSLLSEALR